MGTVFFLALVGLAVGLLVLSWAICRVGRASDRRYRSWTTDGWPGRSSAKVPSPKENEHA